MSGTAFDPQPCVCGGLKTLGAKTCHACRYSARRTDTCPDCGGSKSEGATRCSACNYRLQDIRKAVVRNGGKGTLISPASEVVRLCMSITSEQYERFLVLAQRSGIRRSELLGGWIDSEFVEGEKA